MRLPFSRMLFSATLAAYLSAFANDPNASPQGTPGTETALGDVEPLPTSTGPVAPSSSGLEDDASERNGLRSTEDHNSPSSSTDTDLSPDTKESITIPTGTTALSADGNHDESKQSSDNDPKIIEEVGARTLQLAALQENSSSSDSKPTTIPLSENKFGDIDPKDFVFPTTSDPDGTIYSLTRSIRLSDFNGNLMETPVSVFTNTQGDLTFEGNGLSLTFSNNMGPTAGLAVKNPYQDPKSEQAAVMVLEDEEKKSPPKTTFSGFSYLGFLNNQVTLPASAPADSKTKKAATTAPEDPAAIINGDSIYFDKNKDIAFKENTSPGSGGAISATTNLSFTNNTGTITFEGNTSTGIAPAAPAAQKKQKQKAAISTLTSNSNPIDIISSSTSVMQGEDAESQTQTKPTSSQSGHGGAVAVGIKTTSNSGSSSDKEPAAIPPPTAPSSTLEVLPALLRSKAATQGADSSSPAQPTITSSQRGHGGAIAFGIKATPSAGEESQQQPPVISETLQTSPRPKPEESLPKSLKNSSLTLPSIASNPSTNGDSSSTSPESPAAPTPTPSQKGHGGAIAFIKVSANAGAEAAPAKEKKEEKKKEESEEADETEVIEDPTTEEPVGANPIQALSQAEESPAVPTVLFGNNSSINFLQNTAAGNGGGIYIETGPTTFENNTGTLNFNGNRASNGGAIYTQDSLTFTNNKDIIFTGNIASSSSTDEGNGGAICFKEAGAGGEKASLALQQAEAAPSKSVTFDKNGTIVFQRNIATGNGGAISAKTLSFTENGPVFFLNNTAYQGGAIYVDKQGTLTLSADKSDIVFYGNTSSEPQPTKTEDQVKSLSAEQPKYCRNSLYLDEGSTLHLRASAGHTVYFYDPVFIKKTNGAGVGVPAAAAAAAGGEAETSTSNATTLVINADPAKATAEEASTPALLVINGDAPTSDAQESLLTRSNPDQQEDNSPSETHTHSAPLTQPTAKDLQSNARIFKRLLLSNADESLDSPLLKETLENTESERNSEAISEDTEDKEEKSAITDESGSTGPFSTEENDANSLQQPDEETLIPGQPSLLTAPVPAAKVAAAAAAEEAPTTDFSGTIIFSGRGLTDAERQIPGNVTSTIEQEVKLHKGTLILEKGVTLQVNKFTQEDGSQLIIDLTSKLIAKDASPCITLKNLSINLDGLSNALKTAELDSEGVKGAEIKCETQGAAGRSGRSTRDAPSGGVTLPDTITLLDPEGVLYENNSLGTSGDFTILTVTPGTGEEEEDTQKPSKVDGATSSPYGYQGTWTVAKTAHDGGRARLKTGTTGTPINLHWEYTGYNPDPQNTPYLAASSLWDAHLDSKTIRRTLSNIATTGKFDVVDYSYGQRTWASGVGVFFHQDSKEKTPGFRHLAGGYAAGMYVKAMDGSVITVGWGQLSGKSKDYVASDNKELSSIAAANFQKRIHLSNRSHPVFSATASYGRTNNRLITKSKTFGELRGSWNNLSLGASAEIKDFAVLFTNRVLFSPFLKVDATHARGGSTKENGEQGREYSVQTLSNVSVIPGLSVLKRTRYIEEEEEASEFDASLAYVADIFRKNPTCMATLANKHSWEVDVSNPSKHALMAQVDLKTRLSPRWWFMAHYDFELRSSSRLHDVYVGSKIRF